MSLVSRLARVRLAAAIFVACGVVSSADAGHYAWTTSGPEPGFVFQIVVNPQDSNRIWASAGWYGALVFQSADRGQNWTQSESLVYTSRLVQDPSDANVLYALGYSGLASGVLKTTDGGATWAAASSGLPASPPVSVLALAPSAPGTLYALGAAGGNPGQVFRSLDGAVSWTLVSTAFPASYSGDLVVDPNDPATLYAAASPGVFKSVDGGVTWLSLPADPSTTRLLIDARTPVTIYAAGTGVSKSTDGGASWQAVNGGIADQSIRDLALDPSNPQRLYAASTGSTSFGSMGGLFVTADAGQSWSPVDLGVPVNLATAVAVDPRNPSLVYASASSSGVLHGGLFASADGGATWTQREKGLSGYFSYAIAPDPVLGTRATAASFAKVFRSDLGGSEWTLEGTAAYALTLLVADPSDGDVLYGATSTPDPGGDGVAKSVDGGATWNPASNGLSVSLLHRLAIAPSAPDHLLAASAEGLFGTMDSGGLWSPLLAGDVRAAAVDPADPSILYAGLANTAPSADVLLRSTDGGATWNPATGLPASYPRVFDVAIPRDDPTRVYAAANGAGIYRSIDHGLSFAPAAVGLPAGFGPSRILGDPSDAATLYVYGTSTPAAAPNGSPAAPASSATPTVFRTRDGADSWLALPGFLPAFGVLDLAVGADGRTLYASTLSGVFQFARSFLDVPDADPFWSAVDAAAMNGVTSGCGSGNFCPASSTSRASIAVFLLRGKNGGAYAPPPATGTVFGDVAAGSAAADFIEELANSGVTAGCGGGNYCPGAALTRAAMAVLLLKTEHGSVYTPPPATGLVFADVPADAFAADWIEQLAAEGITAGCGSGNFCPDATVSRAQAAALVVRAFGLS